MGLGEWAERWKPVVSQWKQKEQQDLGRDGQKTAGRERERERQSEREKEKEYIGSRRTSLCADLGCRAWRMSRGCVCVCACASARVCVCMTLLSRVGGIQLQRGSEKPRLLLHCRCMANCMRGTLNKSIHIRRYTSSTYTVYTITDYTHPQGQSHAHAFSDSVPSSLWEHLADSNRLTNCLVCLPSLATKLTHLLSLSLIHPTDYISTCTATSKCPLALLYPCSHHQSSYISQASRQSTCKYAKCSVMPPKSHICWQNPPLVSFYLTA